MGKCQSRPWLWLPRVCKHTVHKSFNHANGFLTGVLRKSSTNCEEILLAISSSLKLGAGMNLFSRITLFLLPVLFAAGCATTHPEVDTWRDARFSVTATNTIAMTDRPAPTQEDAALGRMVTTEMQREGFIFVPAAQADYLLTFVTENPGREQNSVPDISLYLYTNPQKTADGLNVVWRGTIDAGKSLPPDQEPFLIRTLLGYFGQAHDGPVRLAH
jgi:hypothetical protein